MRIVFLTGHWRRSTQRADEALEDVQMWSHHGVEASGLVARKREEKAREIYLSRLVSIPSA